mmetsp:Transcript_5840/g.12876  ORF Transcript_5840/g.12876 Transcript_5840/m.12876 type:complete len:107 (+) Transcript_5840:162-482(+)
MNPLGSMHAHVCIPFHVKLEMFPTPQHMNMTQIMRPRSNQDQAGQGIILKFKHTRFRPSSTRLHITCMAATLFHGENDHAKQLKQQGPQAVIIVTKTTPVTCASLD